MKPLSLGISCYPTFGGSGIVATEIALGMASRGHEVHVLSTRRPTRLLEAPRVHFHKVEARDYPVFPGVPYGLALCSAMVQVARSADLDVLHPHYAVPHATSAWMARQVLGGGPKIVTTLHGTDITLVGSDPSYLPITRHSIAASDVVTAPSSFLRDATLEQFELDRPIEVIPNFVDTERFRPSEGEPCPVFDNHAPVVVHVSNFRPLKRVDWVLDAFVQADCDANLLLIGDGPTRPAVLEQAERLGLGARIRWLGEVRSFEAVLRTCAVFLLPSETESFGLAALEALASGVPVVATEVGGLPEVVQHGETGFLEHTVDSLARRLRQLLRDPEQRGHMARAARKDACRRFEKEPLLDRYEAVYRRMTGRP